MKKRLNLLCAIVLLVLGWSVVVTGYYMVVGAAEGVRQGWNYAKAEHEAREQGRPVTEDAGEMLHMKYISLLPPMLSDPDGKMLPDSVYNERTHSYIPAAYVSLTVSIETRHKWVGNLLSLLILAANIWALVVFIRLVISINRLVVFIRLVISINRSDIFCWRNVRRLRRLGVLLVVAFACSWLSAWVEVEAVRDVLSIPHYELTMTDVVDRISLLLGLCALIVGEVFAIGLRMKEEQDLTI